MDCIIISSESGESAGQLTAEKGGPPGELPRVSFCISFKLQHFLDKSVLPNKKPNVALLLEPDKEIKQTMQGGLNQTFRHKVCAFIFLVYL